MTDIPDGYGLIPGRGRENAQAALAAAEKAKVDPALVRTVADGFLVPEKVLKEYEAGLKKASSTKADAGDGDGVEPEKKPRSTTKKGSTAASSSD